MSAFFVEYRQDPENGWWTATVREESAVVTQGGTLREAHDRVRNAIDLVHNGEARMPLTGETFWDNRDDLDDDVRRIVKEEGDLRVRSLEIEDELELSTHHAVSVLIKSRKFSYRMVGRLLGITHQRVEQIAKSSDAPALLESNQS